jgi:two-component system, NtrC family, response regulator AtoC
VKKVLVIEDDDKIRENILELLREEDFQAIGAADGKIGLAAALRLIPDVIVCDIRMPVMDGHQVLRALRDYPETAPIPFIFLTARALRDDVRLGMSLGADDYLTKPFTRRELLDSIKTRLERQEQVASALAKGATPDLAREPLAAIVRSARMRELYDRAIRAAQTDLSVLLLGETGVGKDVLAHEIHKASPRVQGPFVPLNCAALPENLLETELFGNEKGAFTGAVRAREGLFECARGGTVFLDEIGELPRSIQAKLLRVLEDRKLLRVGGRTLRDVDVRFIAATNRDLESSQEDGFRQDLFFRIGGVVLRIPPLRERQEEIEPLAERFIANACRQLRRSNVPRLSQESRSLLASYHWPGNVRELRNLMEQVVAMSDTPAILPEHLPSALRAPSRRPTSASSDDLREQVRAYERDRIAAALERCAGNQTKAAELLGISRRTLLNRLDEFGLPRPRKS